MKFSHSSICGRSARPARASHSPTNRSFVTSAEKRARNSARSAAFLAAISAVFAASQARGSTLYWAGGSSSATSYPTGITLPPGTWDTSTDNWFGSNGSAPTGSATAWAAGTSNTNIASFGYGAYQGPGALTVGTTVTTNASLGVGGINATFGNVSGQNVLIENTAGSTDSLTLNGGSTPSSSAAITVNGGNNTNILFNNNSSGGLQLVAPNGFTAAGNGNGEQVQINNGVANNSGVSGPIFVNGAKLELGSSGFSNVTSYNLGYQQGVNSVIGITSSTTFNAGTGINFYGGQLNASANTIDHVGLFGNGVINGGISGTFSLTGAHPIQYSNATGGLDGSTLYVENLTTSSGNLVQTYALSNNPFTTGPGSSAANPLPWLTESVSSTNSDANVPAYAIGFGYFDGSGHLQTTSNGALDGTKGSTVTVNGVAGSGTSPYTSANNVSIIATNSNGSTFVSGTTTTAWLDVNLSLVNSDGSGNVQLNSLGVAATNAGGWKTSVGIQLAPSQVMSVTSGGIALNGLFNSQPAFYIGASTFATATNGAPSGTAGALTTPAPFLYITAEDTNNASISVGAQITSNNGESGTNNFGLVKGGTNTVSLLNSVSNNYTGETYVDSGALVLSPTSSAIAVPGNAEVRASGQIMQTVSNAIASGSNLVVDYAGSYAMNNSRTQTLGGLTVNGAVSIGTSVSASTALTVSGEANGTGAINAFTTTGGTAFTAATISPGTDGSIGQLTFQNAGTSGTSLKLTGGFNVDLQNPTLAAGVGFDQLLVKDASSSDVINLNNAALNVNLLGGYSGSNGSFFDILANSAGDAYSGTFNGLSQSADFNVGSEMFQISYTGTSSSLTGGNDIVLEDITSVTPEPASAAIAVGGAGLLALRRRRRRA